MGFNWDLTGISWDLMGVSMDSCENVNRIFHGEHHGVPWFSHEFFIGGSCKLSLKPIQAQK